MSAKDEIISCIVEAVEIMRKTEEQEKEKATKADARKPQAGHRALAAASWSETGAGSSEDTGERTRNAERDKDTTLRGPQCCGNIKEAVTSDGGLAEFGAWMCDASSKKSLSSSRSSSLSSAVKKI